MKGCQTERCQRCKKPYFDIWEVSDKLWAVVTNRSDGGGLYCMSCFGKLARRKGIEVYWTGRKNRFYPHTVSKN